MVLRVWGPEGLRRPPAAAAELPAAHPHRPSYVRRLSVSKGCICDVHIYEVYDIYVRDCAGLRRTVVAPPQVIVSDKSETTVSQLVRETTIRNVLKRLSHGQWQDRQRCV